MGRMGLIRTGRVAVISMVVGLAAPSALALDVDGGTEIHEACRQAGFSEAVCTCIVREAHSRFTHDQMHVLAVVIPDLSRITDDPDIVGLSGETAPLSETQLAHLHQRAVGADIVIQRACGIGLTLDSGR